MATAPIESSGSIKFDDQTFLISYFNEINSHDLSIPSSSLAYENTFKVNNNSSIPMSQLIAIFNGTADLSSFLSLKTHQYSALIPRVRLYRVDYDKSGAKLSDKEFVFDKDYKFELPDIFKPIKRSNGGIKKINWNLAGSNPVTAEKQVEVEVEFYFDSISSLSSGDFDTMRSAWIRANAGYDPSIFSAFDTDTTTKNYWSLLFHPKIDESDPISSSRTRYDTNFFRIKANVGWEDVESNVANELFSNVDINEEIKKLNYSFILNLVEHKFTFNEDGSLNITANYIASFENSLHSYNYNILGPLKKALNIMKTTAIGEIFAGTGAFAGTIGAGIASPLDIVNNLNIENLTEAEKTNITNTISDLSFSDLQQINTIISDKEKLNCLITSVTEPVGGLRGGGVLDVTIPPTTPSFSPSLITDPLSTVSDTFNQIITIASNREKNLFYKELFLNLIEVEKIKTIKINKTTKINWEKWVQGTAVKPSFSDITYIDDAEKTARATQETATVTESVAENVDSNQSATFNPETAKLKSAGVQFESDVKYVSYVTLGDIIENAFQTIKKGLTGDTEYSTRFSTGRLTSDETRLLAELRRQNIICGNISNDTKILSLSEDPSDTSFRTGGRNILDIPIDVKLLKLFLIENIIKPQKDVYSLFSFIKDIITKLAVGALNGSNLYNSQTDVYADTSLATTVFSLGDASAGLNPMTILETDINIGDSTSLQNNIEYHYINNINIHNDYYNYILVYDKKFVDFYPTSDPIEDQKLGIYHYTVGEDIGLLKSANFSRIDTPYLKEAKAVGRQTFYLGQFRDAYNVDLTMVGNNIYYPGMMLYIQPSAEAIQTVDRSDPESNPSFSQITGIGGYYFVEKVSSTISEEGYETKLSCIWQYDGTEKPETINGVSECDILFSNTSSQQLLNTLITRIQNNVEIQARTAATEAARFETETDEGTAAAESGGGG